MELACWVLQASLDSSPGSKWYRVWVNKSCKSPHHLRLYSTKLCWHHYLIYSQVSWVHKKGFYIVVPVCMHISKSFLCFVSLSNLHTQNTLKLHDDFNLLHDPIHILHPVFPFHYTEFTTNFYETDVSLRRERLRNLKIPKRSVHSWICPWCTLLSGLY